MQDRGALMMQGLPPPQALLLVEVLLTHPIDSQELHVGVIPLGLASIVRPIVLVRVKARGTDKVVEAYALLDSGSTCTWCTEKLVKNLGAEGPTLQVSLMTIEKENRPTFSSRVSLEIMDLEENVMIELPHVLSKEKLNNSQSGISSQADVDRLASP